MSVLDMILILLYATLFSSYTVIFCIILNCSLSQLTQLDILDIGDNPLNTVPDVVSSLTSLKQLNMNNCGISSLPERFVCQMFITTSQHHNHLPLVIYMHNNYSI